LSGGGLRPCQASPDGVVTPDSAAQEGKDIYAWLHKVCSHDGTKYGIIFDGLSAFQGTLALLLIAAELLQYGIHIVSDLGHNPGQPAGVVSYFEPLETLHQSVQALSPRGALLSAHLFASIN
jgi:hypothetical protein